MAVALSCDCRELGLSLRGLNSVVRAVAMLIGGTIQAVVVISDCKDLISRCKHSRRNESSTHLPRRTFQKRFEPVLALGALVVLECGGVSDLSRPKV